MRPLHNIGVKTLPIPTTPQSVALRRSDFVGVFDSGVGGLSVLREMHAQRPDVNLRYVADVLHAPYGERAPAEVIERSLKIARHLIEEGAQAVVVACNTATACAIDALRAHFPGVRFVGVEPGIKPAALSSPGRRVGVLATSATLQSARFQSLVHTHAQGCDVTTVPCPGLALAIERGLEGRAEVMALLERYCSTLKLARVDTVVLGCTHYPLVRDLVSRCFADDVRLVDTAQAVSRHVFSHWPPAEPHPCPAPASPQLETTGDPAMLRRVASDWLGWSLDVAALQL